MRKIFLGGKFGKGKFVLVDDENFEFLNKFKWYCSDQGYAVRKTKRLIRMHRLIINAKKGEQVDHINRNRLDNRKINLRIANQFVNMHNMSLKKVNKSGYKGVSWDKLVQKWRAQIKINYKSIYLGVFLNKEDANKAYNEAERTMI